MREGREDVSPTTEDPVELANRKPDPYRHILVALDFTPHSSHALALALARALELVRLHDSKLSLIHAVENSFYPDLGYDPLMIDPGEFAELDQQIHDQAVLRMEQLAKSLDYADVQHDVLWGTPKSAVLSYAEAQKVDLIVVGSHGRHGIAKLLGSTAVAIVHSARCDVFVVRLAE